eukprot:4655793-Amphidinium_carterae.2
MLILRKVDTRCLARCKWFDSSWNLTAPLVWLYQTTGGLDVSRLLMVKMPRVRRSRTCLKGMLACPKEETSGSCSRSTPLCKANPKHCVTCCFSGTRSHIIWDQVGTPSLSAAAALQLQAPRSYLPT